MGTAKKVVVAAGWDSARVVVVDLLQVGKCANGFAGVLVVGTGFDVFHFCWNMDKRWS